MARSGRLALLVVLAVLAGVGVLLGAWLYGPVEQAVGKAGPAGDRESRKMTWQESIGARGVDVMVVHAARHDEYSFALDIRNSGHLPLTFGRFEPGDEALGVRISDVRISRNASEFTGGGPVEWIPLDGVTIEPGQARELRVTVTHDICDPGDTGETSSFSTVELPYGVGPLRWNHELELPFDVTLLCGEIPAEGV